MVGGTDARRITGAKNTRSAELASVLELDEGQQ